MKDHYLIYYQEQLDLAKKHVQPVGRFSANSNVLNPFMTEAVMM